MSRVNIISIFLVVMITGLTHCSSFAKSGSLPDNVVGYYNYADLVEEKDACQVKDQPDQKIFSCEIKNATSIDVSGDLIGVFFPRDVPWKTEWPTETLNEGARIAQNRAYQYARVPERFRNLKVTRGLVDSKVNYRISFAGPTSTSLWLIGPKTSVKIKVMSFHPACFPVAESIRPDQGAVEPVWNSADRLVDFLRFPSDTPLKAEVQTEVTLLHDDQNLYLLARAQLPAGQENTSCATNRDSDQVWAGDCLEFFFQPDPEIKTYYHFAVNQAGGLYDAKVVVASDFTKGEMVAETREMDVAWNSGADTGCYVNRKADEWLVKMRIPLKSLIPAGLPENAVWRVNVARQLAAGVYSSWAFLDASTGFHAIDQFRPLIIAPRQERKAASCSNWMGGKREGETGLTMKQWQSSGMVEFGTNGIMLLPSPEASIFQDINVTDAGGKRLKISAFFASDVPEIPVVMNLIYEDADRQCRKIRVFEYILTLTNMTCYLEDAVIPETARKLVKISLERGPGGGSLRAKDINVVLDSLQFNHQVRPYAGGQVPIGPTRPPTAGKPELIYRSDRTALSPDCILPVVFGLRFAKAEAGREGKVVFDLPAELVDPYIRTSRHPREFADKAVMVKQLKMDGIEYTRYTAPVQLLGETPRGQVSLFVKAHCPPGRFLRIGYFLEAPDGKAQPERWLDVEVISVPAGPTPRKYLFLISNLVLVWELPSIPGSADVIKRVGLNGIEQWDIIGFDDYRTKFFAFCERNGLQVAGEYSPVVSYPYLKGPSGLRGNRDMQASDIDGKIVLDGYVKKPCPSYRGPKYHEQANFLRGYVKHGIDTFTFDEEVFGPGERICFCDRCKWFFKEYMKKNHPRLPDIAMANIAREPSRYPEHARAWAMFKADLVTQWYRDYRTAIEDEWEKAPDPHDVKIYVTSQTMATGAGVGYGTPEYMSCLRDNATRLSEGIIQAIMPMAYLYQEYYGGSIRKVARDYINLQKTWAPYTDGKPALFPYFLSGGGGMCFLEPQRAIKYMLYEAVTAGAVSGGVLFHAGGMDGYHWKYLAEALHAIAKVEDILWGGVMEELACDTAGAEARIIRNKDQAVLFVSHYGYEPVDVSVKFSPPCKLAVMDPETEEKIMALETGAKSIPVKIGVNRARLLKLSPAPVSGH